MSVAPGLLLTVALHGQLLGNIWPPVEEPPPPPPPPVQQSLTPSRDAECTRSAAKGNLFGETAQVRQEPGLPQMSAALARAAAAARLSQDAEVARDVLAAYLGDGTTDEAQLARLQLAYALLRLVPEAPQSMATEIRALLQPDAAFAAYSDAHYIRAVLARSEGHRTEALTHIDRALAINPRFYNAVILRALLLLRDAEAAFRRSGQCPALFEALTVAVVPVANLGACPLQLGHFRLALERALPGARGARRAEFLDVLDLALAYAARKDEMHKAVLGRYSANPEALCQGQLQRYDFGRDDR